MKTDRGLEGFCDKVLSERWASSFGRVQSVRRDAVRVFLPQVRVGAICRAETDRGPVALEIVSLHPEGHVAMPLDDLGSIRLGDPVYLEEDSATLPVGDALLGRVVDSRCIPYEGPALRLTERRPLFGGALNPLTRECIREPLDLGIRSLNACLTCGKGQRQGIFAGSGVGKSVLLGMMARYTAADVVVIALVGERGREVREFLENDLGDGRRKSVLVVETADKSPVRRVRGAHAAVAIAEHFREQGAQVLLMMDSLTRFAMAQREIGLAAGEPPTTKGYTPSVFGSLARLTERAGNWGKKGSITGLYTVLVEGDDFDDPIADCARSILDGHVVLSRRLANRGQYPAVDILGSVSRCMDAVVPPEHLQASIQLRRWLARYQENEDAIHYGMYQRGSDSSIDECIEMEPRLREFLTQNREERADWAVSHGELLRLATPSRP